MECTLHLEYSYRNNSGIEMKGKDDLPMLSMPSFSGNMFEVENFSKTVSLIEDGWYSIECTLSDPLNDLEIGAKLLLNGEVIADQTNWTENDEGTMIRFDFLSKCQPFLLLYDIALLEVRLCAVDGRVYSFNSGNLVCLSSKIIDSENVKSMISELINLEDATINEWMFRPTSQPLDEFGMIQGSFRDHTYKSLASYIQIAEEICTCYKTNLGYFRTQPHSVLIQVHTLQPFEKTRRITTDGVLWLGQNLEQLHEVEHSGITRNEQSYLPAKMLSSETKRSLNTYENKIVVAFLRAVYKKNAWIISSFEKNIQREKELIASIRELEKNDFRAPIVTVKEMTLKNTTESIQTLKNVNGRLRELLGAYTVALPCSEIPFNEIPRKTKVFQEVRAYAQVYEEILRWIRFGEFSFERENLIIHIRKIDKLYEYYCLYRLLNMMKAKGFQAVSKDGITSYAYTLPPFSLYRNEIMVANTYQLTNGNDILTLFYTPVIHSHKTENSINLYRTTRELTANSYYAPDFLIRIESSYQKEKYVVLDAKYSKNRSIRDHYLNDEIMKYVNQIAHIDNSYLSIVMMWLLQGRIDTWKTGDFYHSSIMAKKYKPLPSIGILPLNATTPDLSELWEEIQATMHPIPQE